MKKIFRLFVMTVMVGLVPTMTSCQGMVDAVLGEQDNPASTTPTVVHVSGITISGYTSDSGTTASTTVPVGTKLQLSVIVSPADTKEVEVAWKSGDETVVTVTDDGVVTAVGIGQAIVSVTSKINASITATLNVNVVEGNLNINTDAIDQSRADARG